MKLFWIAEGAASTLKPLIGRQRFKQLKKSLAFMPGKKVKHSMRVGATAAKAGLSPEDVEAAILHDYIERGGDVGLLDKLQISNRARRVIDMLSITEKTPGADDTAEVQHHIEQMIADRSLPEHDKNIAIIVKCADRIDNVKKRVRENRLTPEYKAASAKLFNTLIGGYTGERELMTHIDRKIGRLGVF